MSHKLCLFSGKLMQSFYPVTRFPLNEPHGGHSLFFAVKPFRSGRDISFCSSCVFQNKTKGKDTLKRMGLAFFETCCLFSVGVCVFCVWSVSFLSWFWLAGQNKTEGSEKDSKKENRNTTTSSNSSSTGYVI